MRPERNGTNTRARRQGNRIDIDGGRLSRDQRNLFHSFEQFGLNAEETANFLSRPEIHNILGRVVGGDPSVINGLLRVSGGNSNLFLINPAGIVFGRNARLDVPGSFTATTANGVSFGNSWFNAVGSNNYEALVGDPDGFAFTMSQPGSIVNYGDLAVPAGQSLNLSGGAVVNLGKLSAPGGEITVTAVQGEQMIRLSREGMILRLEIPVSASANGEALPNSLPFNPLTLPQLLTVGADPSVAVNPDSSVTLTASGTAIPTEPGTAIASSTIDASCGAGVCPAQAGIGGAVTILGERVGLVSANINASGVNGGGTVRVGGDYQGSGTIPNAERTVVSADSLINADALESGNGGRVIVWADEATEFSGNISARGGSTSGNGGFAEVSGKDSLTFQGLADLRALNGIQGTLLLDPTDIVISGTPTTGTLLSTTLQDQLALGNVILTTTAPPGTPDPGQAGSITVNAPVVWASGFNLTLQADRNITVSQNIISNTNPLTNTSGNITLEANILRASTGDFAGIVVGGGSIIRTDAGNISLTATGGTGAENNIGIVTRTSSQIISRDGDIRLVGTGGGDGTGGRNVGVYLGFGAEGNTIRTTGNGSIYIEGRAGRGVGANNGVILYFSNLSSAGGNITLTGIGAGSLSSNSGIAISSSTIRTTSEIPGRGNITLTGTGSAAGAAGASNGGVGISGINSDLPAIVAADGSGNIFIEGIGGNSYAFTQGFSLDRNSTLSSNNGDIRIRGVGGSGNISSGIDLSSDLVGVSQRIISTGRGSIYLDGTGGASGVNPGISVGRYAPGPGNGTITESAKIEASGTGSISLKGSGRNGADDVVLSDRGGIVTNANSIVELTGDITFVDPFSLRVARINHSGGTLTGTGAFPFVFQAEQIFCR